MGEERETIEILDESDDSQSESVVGSLVFEDDDVKIKGKVKGGLKNGGKGKKVGKKKNTTVIEEVFQTLYHNDTIWSCFRALGSLSSQVTNKDGDEQLAYIDCMLTAESEDVREVGKAEVGKGVVFSVVLPFLICWILDKKRPTTTGWVGGKEKLPRKELVKEASNFLKEMIPPKKKSGGLLDNISITDLNVGLLMMATWEEMEEYGKKRGLSIVRNEEIGIPQEVQESLFIKEARILFEKLNKFKLEVPID